MDQLRNSSAAVARRSTVPDIAQKRLRQYIIDTGRRQGDLLPTEAVLSAQLGISRASLREGMRLLQATGVIESRQGSGTYVGHLSFDPLVEAVEFSIRTERRSEAVKAISDLLEVREALEIRLIRDAARLSTPEEIAALRDIVDRMASKARSGQEFLEEEKEFHRRLYVRSANAIFKELVAAFWDVTERLGSYLSPLDESLAEIAESHRTIVDALADRNEQRAADVMCQHFAGIRRRISKTSASTGDQE